jgi:lysozyme family protein
MPTFESLRREYAALWDGMQIRPERKAPITNAANKIIKSRERYEAIEAATGVPWYVVGVIHLRESDCDFACALHNGDRIIGTGRKTYRVPKGKGPFATFEASAVDALQHDGLVGVTDWSVERIAYAFEKFNGFGYRPRGVNSPYLWAGTNQYSRGKYIHDGPSGWRAGVVDVQLGSMSVLKRIEELAEITIPRVDGEQPPVASPKAYIPESAPKEVHKELKQTSRGYSLTVWARAALALITGATASVLKAVDAGVDDPWGWITGLATFIQTYGLKLAFIAAIGGVAVLTLLLSLRRSDTLSGRYEPSGKDQ